MTSLFNKYYFPKVIALHGMRKCAPGVSLQNSVQSEGCKNVHRVLYVNIRCINVSYGKLFLDDVLTHRVYKVIK